MIEKIILGAILVLMIGVSAWFLYENLPGTPTQLQGNILNVSSKNYSEVKMFYPNMRFETNNISYYIDSACTSKKTARILNALSIISQSTGILNFYAQRQDNAEILIGCSKDFIPNGENVVVAGEGGPTKIIDTGEFNVVFQGRVIIYQDSSCGYPVVEIHEILHVFGFDHVNDSSNIMYPYSSCDQKMSSEDVLTLDNLYSVESLPDLYFSSVNATKSGRYLDFNVEVRNGGLQNSSGSTLAIYDSNNNNIGSFDVGSIGVGAGKILYAQNVKLPSRDTNQISFKIEDGAELSTDNNQIFLNVQS